jgi:hypothetical protein
MALLTGQPNMPARQREVGFVVIEGDILPVGGLVAGGAVGSEFPGMLIILLMARIAIGRCTFVNVANVAIFALSLGVCTFKLERRKVVVELGGLPAIGGMAGSAVGSKPALVGIIFLVTGMAVCRRFRKIGQGSRIGMTLRADQVAVHAGQLERKFMLEIVPKSIHAIMTVEACLAIFKRMAQGEGRIHLTVAGLAGVRSEGRYIAVMTIVTGERFARRCKLMPLQGESHHLMRELRALHYG